LNEKIKHKFQSLINLGFSKELSSLNIVRYRVINIINYLIFSGGFILLLYRIYFFNLTSILFNSALILLMALNIFFCKNSHHNKAIKLTAIYLIGLSIRLCSTELFISGIMYLAVLPLAFSLLHTEQLLKHIYYGVCAIIFTYFSRQLNLDNTILFTYYLITFGLYIIFSSFFNLVEQKQKELETAVTILETKNTVLRQFNHITSHDLQEPLGIISNFSKILTSKYSHTLDEVGRKSVEHIQNASNRMSALIKGLLDYSLIGNSSTNEPIIVAELIKNIKKELKPTLETTNTTIIVDDIPIIFGDRVEIQMLFQQLILNAIKFRQQHIETIIRISVKEKDGFWQLSVKDNGIGIKKEHLVKIFNIFQRLHTRGKYEGYGIGLSHCKKIVHLHGGTIWATSIPNHGSIFHFTIPRKIILTSSGRIKAYF